MTSYKEIANQLQSFLNLRTPALALKFYENKNELGDIPQLKRPDWKPSMCQALSVARTYGWTLGVTLKDLGLPNCGAVIGLGEMPQEAISGKMMQGVWFETIEDAQKHMQQMPRIPAGRFNAVVVEPLVKERFKPEIILIYGTPAQMVRLIAAIQWKDYERLNFFSVGETACADSIAQCWLSQKPSLAIPCFGERRFGGVMEDELVMAIPAKIVTKIMEGFEGTERSGIRYPIPFYGLVVDPAPGMPSKYQPIISNFRGQAE